MLLAVLALIMLLPVVYGTVVVAPGEVVFHLVDTNGYIEPYIRIECGDIVVAGNYVLFENLIWEDVTIPAVNMSVVDGYLKVHSFLEDNEIMFDATPLSGRQATDIYIKVSGLQLPFSAQVNGREYAFKQYPDGTIKLFTKGTVTIYYYNPVKVEARLSGKEVIVWVESPYTFDAKIILPNGEKEEVTIKQGENEFTVPYVKGEYELYSLVSQKLVARFTPEAIPIIPFDNKTLAVILIAVAVILLIAYYRRRRYYI